MPLKVILDMDPGVDDAVALCLALADPRLDVVAVTATGGNVDPAQATRNVQAIIERVDPPKWPRIGAADPLQPLRTDARGLHGPQGLGGVELPVAEKANRHASVKVIADEARKAPGEVALIGAGPWTNVAAVLTREPEIADLLKSVLVVGGSISAGGNVTAAAEFNVYCDAGSASETLRSDANTTMLPLDVTSDMTFGYDLLEFVRSRSSRTATLLAEILPGFYRAYRQRFGIEGCCLHDVAAVVAAAYPSLATATAMHCEVETSGGVCHGATVFDRRPTPEQSPNIRVITALDTTAARDVLFRTLENAA